MYLIGILEYLNAAGNQSHEIHSTSLNISLNKSLFLLASTDTIHLILQNHILEMTITLNRPLLFSGKVIQKCTINAIDFICINDIMSENYEL